MKQNSATETESTSAPILRRTPSQSRAQEKFVALLNAPRR